MGTQASTPRARGQPPGQGLSSVPGVTSPLWLPRPFILARVTPCVAPWLHGRSAGNTDVFLKLASKTPVWEPGAGGQDVGFRAGATLSPGPAEPEQTAPGGVRPRQEGEREHARPLHAALPRVPAIFMGRGSSSPSLDRGLRLAGTGQGAKATCPDAAPRCGARQSRVLGDTLLLPVSHRSSLHQTGTTCLSLPRSLPSKAPALAACLTPMSSEWGTAAPRAAQTCHEVPVSDPMPPGH